MTELPEPDYDEAIAVVVANLAGHFPAVAEDDIRRLVTTTVVRIAGDTKAPSFVAVLAEKEVREVLDARS